MRTIIIVIWLVIFVIITLPLLLIFYLISKKNVHMAERAVHTCLCWLFGTFRFLAGTNLTVEGLENVPTDKPVMYISNHRSFFDIIYTYPLCALPTAYVAKSSLANIPFFGVWGKLMRVLMFDRDDAKAAIQMISTGSSYLKSDTSVYICPEGTRNKNTTQLPLLEFHNGSFKMAVKSGAPIIPIAISNAADVWEAHMPWVHSTDMKIIYGKPVYVKELSDYDKKHIGEYMRDIITNMLKENS